MTTIVEIVEEPELELPWLPEEARIVIANYDWLVRNRDAELDIESKTVFVRDGGFDISCLLQRGFTPATRDYEYYFGEPAA